MRELNVNELELVNGGDLIDNPESELGKTINDLHDLTQSAGKALGGWLYELINE
ncbi:hypothetical protein [Thalassotalea marina]|uniref:Bacteriocin n=1 Tax=Thalassotalea marina TaxID=1673741 RepID=A0A919BAF4_9GAMM|nr:hypothetical protein [Thalassotalea marina]GHF78830.1 hypothetical protein GCM10017161_02410 [Thalassotalea marina]